MTLWKSARLALGAGLLSVLLAACGEPSKQDILEKAEGIDSKAELKDALGDPDDINKVGPIEQWTYDAADGKVVFVITGDSITIKAAGGSGDD